MDIFILKKEDKIKLVELLLIIGGIFGAFKITGAMFTVFVVFLFFTLLYFVCMTSTPKKMKLNPKLPKLINYFITLPVAMLFSSLITVMVVQEMVPDLIVRLSTACGYFVLSSFVLYFALKFHD